MATPLHSSRQKLDATIPGFVRSPLSVIARAHMSDRLQLSGRHLTSRLLLPASAKKAHAKVWRRHAANSHARRWRARAPVASTQDEQARREIVPETARAWPAQEASAVCAKLRPPPEIRRPRARHRIRAAVRDRPAIFPCNCRVEPFRKFAG